MMMYGRWGGGPGFGGGYMMGGHPGFGIIGMVLCALFWVAVIVLAVRLFRKGYFRGISSPKTEDNALAILRERFAKGEIDSEDYQRRREDLLR